jgi:2-dehydro-3-deoxygalactonokinase
MAQQDGLIAVDWGTSRLRAYRLDGAGRTIAHSQADDGIMAIAPGEFPEALAKHIGPWLAETPNIPVVMAGMVGSRNGWREIPYATLPAGCTELARGLAQVRRADGGVALIVPGLAGEAPSGLPDVLRGEETLALGAGLPDGILCLPGTHSKWVAMQRDRIVAFASFMTGESYSLFRNHSILGRLAEMPADPGGARMGSATAGLKGGLTHQLFSARTRVLSGAMSGGAVEPYLSALLIRAEIDGALALFPMLRDGGLVTLVADGLLAETYSDRIAETGMRVSLVSPEQALLAGLRRILAARGD